MVVESGASGRHGGIPTAPFVLLLGHALLAVHGCRDFRLKPGVCAKRKAEGKCNEWGCDRTCGNCMLHGLKLTDRRSAAIPLYDDYDVVRNGDWWVRYAYAMGRYTTVVVPTMCKRLERLQLQVHKVLRMPCVYEVMIATRSPCVEAATAALRTVNTRNHSDEGQHIAFLTIADLTTWDQVYGPAGRFLAAQQAAGSVLVHLDDDELPCERQVCMLAARALKRPIGIYGHHKRRCDHRGYTNVGDPRRKSAYAHSPYNVILTLFAATSRAFNDAFVRHFDHYSAVLMNTHGNGEDIAYSHFLQSFFNVTPTFVQKEPCYRWDVNGTDVYARGASKLHDDVGMSSSKRHYKLRKQLCKNFWEHALWSEKQATMTPPLELGSWPTISLASLGLDYML